MGIDAVAIAGYSSQLGRLRSLFLLLRRGTPGLCALLVSCVVRRVGCASRRVFRGMLGFLLGMLVMMVARTREQDNQKNTLQRLFAKVDAQCKA